MLNRFIYAISILVSFCFLNTANAATPAAVNANSCQLLKNTTEPFILVVKRGDDLIAAITDCANAAELKSAVLTGLGAIDTPTLGYLNLNTKKYQFKTFPKIYEISSLNGNIGFADGKRFAHVHVTVSGDNYKTFGGHLKDAKAGATAEITFFPLATSFERKEDKTVGMKLIATDD